MTEFSNPQNVHAPVGGYSHTAVVPAGASLVFVSGQVGLRPDGSLPASFAEQAEQVFANVRSCLAAHGLGMDAVVKLTTFIAPGQDLKVMREARQRSLGSHRPTSTAVFVAQLVDPALLLEVEVVALKPA